MEPDERVASLQSATSVPALSEATVESSPASLSTGEGGDGEWPDGRPVSTGSTFNKRRLFGMGRGKENGEPETAAECRPILTAAPVSANVPPIATGATASPILSTDAGQTSPSPLCPNHHPSSPNRRYYSSSPRLPSPASSQIFERNVQENSLPAPTSPAIPAHIQTENHIPPVLEASSLAITDGHLDPDDVEIVMHSAHQPAAVTVTGTGSSEVVGMSFLDDTMTHQDNDDAASNYGSLDAADVRRLSFISFADVVQAEHVEQSNNRDSTHSPGLPSPSGSPWANRSPSPVRSLLSSTAFGTSPPTSGTGSLRGLDGSPGRGGKAPNSPTVPHSPPMGGELTIETMRQALRKTGSGDLGGARSQPLSAVSGEDVASDHPWR
ncbi:MAG: hypothetical protein M1839_008070 [Geoglossum umbratile]|nr:MAG: hypothetical protein M1839_008070 [Geoglossum umbratile]